LRGDFGGAGEFTLAQRVAGTEISRVRGEVTAGEHDEVIFAFPASWVRQLPIVDIDVLLTAHEGGAERPVGRYTLVHEGSLARSLARQQRIQCAGERSGLPFSTM